MKKILGREVKNSCDLSLVVDTVTGDVMRSLEGEEESCEHLINSGDYTMREMITELRKTYPARYH